MNDVRSTKSCDGCIYLGSMPDAAGGGLYKCRKRPGLVVGEWGHWAVPEYNKPTHPAEWDCYEKGERWQTPNLIGMCKNFQKGLGEIKSFIIL